MLFNHWYTSLTSLVEGAGNVSRSAAAATTFWMAMAKVGSCCRSACLKSRFMLVQVGQPSLNSSPFVGKLASSPCGFLFDVILWGASSFLLVSCQLLREGCWCSGLL
jgi:hypothetical protein